MLRKWLKFNKKTEDWKLRQNVKVWNICWNKWTTNVPNLMLNIFVLVLFASIKARSGDRKRCRWSSSFCFRTFGVYCLWRWMTSTVSSIMWRSGPSMMWLICDRSSWNCLPVATFPRNCRSFKFFLEFGSGEILWPQCFDVLRKLPINLYHSSYVSRQIRSCDNHA